MKQFLSRNKKSGYSLLIVLIMTPLLVAAFAMMLTAVDTEVRLSLHEVMTYRAQLLAEDGLNVYIANEDPSEDSFTWERTEFQTAEVTTRRIEEERWELTSTSSIIRPHGDYHAAIRSEIVPDGEDGWRMAKFEYLLPSGQPAR